MLINPFVETEPAYSANPTGVIRIDEKIGTDAVSLLLYIKLILEAAGWTEIDREPSKAKGETIRAMMPTAAPAVPPRVLEELPDPCTQLLFPQWIQASIGDKAFTSYNPFVYMAPLNDCADRVWYPAGLTPEDTAENLAQKMTDVTPYLVQYIGNVVDPGMPFLNEHMQFTLEAKEPATFENDWMPLSIGGSRFSSQGFIKLKSPNTPSGRYMTAKLSTMALTSLGVDEDAVQGALTPLITIGGSGGEGTFAQPMYPSGEYWMQASNYQFVIWNERTGREGSMLLASMPRMDASHMTGADAIVAVGSESIAWFGFTQSFQELVDRLYWTTSVASGYGNTLHEVGYRTQDSSKQWRSPAMMLSALRGTDLRTLSETPFVQAAYILLSPNPNIAEVDRIAGRLWDMILTTTANSGSTGQGTVMHDEQTWRRLSASASASDLSASLFVLG